MPLDKQIIDIPLGGLQTKVDSKLVRPGEMLELENCVFDSLGGVQKRPGYNVVQGASVDLSHKPKHICSRKGETVVIGVDRAYGCSDDVNQRDLGPVYTCSSHDYLVAYDPAAGAIQKWPSVASCYANGVTTPVVVNAWQEGTATGRVRVAVTRLDGGERMIEDATLETLGETVSGVKVDQIDGPRLVTVGTTIFCVWAIFDDTTGGQTYRYRVRMSYLDCTDVHAGWSAPTQIQQLAATTGQVGAIEACAYGSYALAAHTFGIVRFNAAGAQGSAMTFVAAPVPLVDIATDGTRIFAAFGGGSIGVAQFPSFGSSQDSSVSIGSGHQAALLCDGYGVFVYVTLISSEPNPAMPNGLLDKVYSSYVDPAGAITTQDATTIRISQARVAGKPFFMNAQAYLPIVHAEGADGSGDYGLIVTARGTVGDADNCIIASRFQFQRISSHGYLGQVAQLNNATTGPRFRLASVGLNGQGPDGTTKSYGVVGVDLDFSPRVTTAEYGDTLYMASGGMLWEYDGNAWAENGFLGAPTLNPYNLGSQTNKQEFFAVWEATDSNGNVTLSAPSLPVMYDPTDAESFLNVSVPLTNRSKWAVRIYCTERNGTVPYFQKDAGPTAGSWYSVDHTYMHPPKTTTQVLYTYGGTVENASPETPDCVVASKQRIFTYDGNGNVSYCRTILDRESASFSQFLNKRVDFKRGEDSILATMDGNVILLTESAVQVMSGDGPADDGSADDYRVTSIPIDSGIEPGTGHCASDIGIMYKGVSGIQVLERSLQISDAIGAPVHGYADQPHNTFAVVSGSSHIRIASTNGYMYVYDYLARQWARWSFTAINSRALSAATIGGRHCFLSNTGAVYRESDDYMDGGTNVFNAFVSTPWIHLGSIQGHQRVTYVGALGTYRTPAVLSISAAYDYDDTTAVTASSQFDAGMTAGGVAQMRKHLGSRCEAIKLRIGIQQVPNTIVQRAQGFYETWTIYKPVAGQYAGKTIYACNPVASTTISVGQYFMPSNDTQAYRCEAVLTNWAPGDGNVGMFGIVTTNSAVAGDIGENGSIMITGVDSGRIDLASISLELGIKRGGYRLPSTRTV
jgi:hypothetical protein